MVSFPCLVSTSPILTRSAVPLLLFIHCQSHISRDHHTDWLSTNHLKSGLCSRKPPYKRDSFRNFDSLTFSSVSFTHLIVYLSTKLKLITASFFLGGLPDPSGFSSSSSQWVHVHRDPLTRNLTLSQTEMFDTLESVL